MKSVAGRLSRVRNFRCWPGRSLAPAVYIFSAVLLLRLIVLARFTGSAFLLPSQGDMHYYNAWALRILQGQFTDYQAFYGLPLYPYFLASLYALFGYSPFVPGLLQICAESGTAVLLYQLAVLSFRDGLNASAAGNTGLWQRILAHPGPCIGYLAAAGWAFYIPGQAYSVILMPTALAAFVFWFVVLQVVKRRELPRAGFVFLLGLLIGFVTMGVATTLFLLPLVIAALLIKWGHRSRPHLQQAALALIALLLGVFVGALPCWAHNYFVARDPVFLSAHSGVNFWIGNNPLGNGYPRFPPGLRAGQTAMLEDSIKAAESAAGRTLPRSEVSDYWAAKAKQYIRENPVAWLKLLGRKARNFWNAFQYDDLSIITNLREQRITLPGIDFGLVAALGLAGMVSVLGQYRESRWIAAAVFLQMASLLPVFVTERYRLAAVPGLLLFASAGLWRFWKSCATRQPARGGVYLLALVAATLLVSMPQKSAALWALDAYNSGWQALEAKNLPLAAEKLQLAHAYVPDNAEINLALGNLRQAQGDRTQAKTWYAEALRLEPDHRSALNNLGILEMEAGRLDAAERLFRQALEIDPRSAKLHYLLAKTALAKGEIAAARAEIALALEITPAQPEFVALREEIDQKNAAP